MRRPFRLCRPDGRRIAYATAEAAVRAARAHCRDDPLRAIVGGWGCYAVERRRGRMVSTVCVVTFDGDGRMVSRTDYDQTKAAA